MNSVLKVNQCTPIDCVTVQTAKDQSLPAIHWGKFNFVINHEFNLWHRAADIVSSIVNGHPFEFYLSYF